MPVTMCASRSMQEPTHDVDGETGEQTSGRRSVLQSVATGAVGVAGLSSGATAAEEPDVNGKVVMTEDQFSEEELQRMKEEAEEGISLPNVTTTAVDCSGSESEDCPPPSGECNCFYECACVDPRLYRRECCCCDDDDRNGCSNWDFVGSC